MLRCKFEEKVQATLCDFNNFFLLATKKEEWCCYNTVAKSRFCFSGVATKIYFSNKIHHDFNVAYHAQRIFCKKMEYDKSVRRNLILFWTSLHWFEESLRNISWNLKMWTAKLSYSKFFNSASREKLIFTQFSTKIYWNKSLAASNLFYMITQSIKFYPHTTIKFIQ